jgi:hypothetical protein
LEPSHFSFPVRTPSPQQLALAPSPWQVVGHGRVARQTVQPLDSSHSSRPPDPHRLDPTVQLLPGHPQLAPPPLCWHTLEPQSSVPPEAQVPMTQVPALLSVLPLHEAVPQVPVG